MSDVTLTRTGPDTAADKAGRANGLLRLPFALRERARPEYAAIRTVLGYWEIRRGARIAPARSEIEPAPLAEALRFMFIAELVAPGVARLRFAGQHLHDLLGMEPRGMPLSCLLAAPSRDELAEALARVQKGARVQLPLRAARGLGKPGMDGLLALMPLTDSAGQITRVLGVLETHGQIGRTPRRFDLAAEPASLDLRAIAGDGATGATGAGAASSGNEVAKTDSQAENATIATPDSGRPAHSARPGWRVIKGGRG
ncbi:MAG: PAS domain-containing protein [Pararhodobacter sp.]|nr:PAS domain-containing protein [Pararhodobacter sp.]